MKKSTKKFIQRIIDEEYQTDWEFIVDTIAPQIEEEEFDVDEICQMVWEETVRRGIKLNQFN